MLSRSPAPARDRHSGKSCTSRSCSNGHLRRHNCSRRHTSEEAQWLLTRELTESSDRRSSICSGSQYAEQHSSIDLTAHGVSVAPTAASSAATKTTQPGESARVKGSSSGGETAIPAVTEENSVRQVHPKSSRNSVTAAADACNEFYLMGIADTYFAP